MHDCSLYEIGDALITQGGEIVEVTAIDRTSSVLEVKTMTGRTWRVFWATGVALQLRDYIVACYKRYSNGFQANPAPPPPMVPPGLPPPRGTQSGFALRVTPMPTEAQLQAYDWNARYTHPPCQVHTPVDTGMRVSWCSRCDVGMRLDGFSWVVK